MKLPPKAVGNQVQPTANEDSTGGGLSVRGPGILTMRRSLVSGNVVECLPPCTVGVERAAGLYLADTSGTAINSTISNNTAGSAASTPTSSNAGGIFLDGGTLSISHVTLAGNNAFDATGIDQLSASGTTYTASIIDGGNNPCAGTMVSGGFNALATSNPECPSNMTTDVVGPTGVALAVAANGGPIVGGTGGSAIRSLAIDASGIADDNVLTASCPSGIDATDMRGVSRPQGAGCDSGAFEIQCTTPITLPGCPALSVTAPPPATPGSTGQQAAARKKCKKKKSTRARKKCKKKASQLPV